MHIPQQYIRFLALLSLCFLFLAEPLHAQDKNQKPPGIEELQGTSKGEDLYRFFGSEDPLAFRYLSMPYDAVMNTNLKEFTIELGYLLLLLLPLALFLSPRIKPVFWISTVLLLLLFLTISIGSSYCQKYGLDGGNASAHLAELMAKQHFSEEPMGVIRSGYTWAFLQLYTPLHQGVMSVSSMPDKLTYPLLAAIFVAVLFLLYQRYKSLELEKQAFLLFSYFYGSLWLLLAAGLPWYGLLLFPLAIIATVYAWGKKGDSGLFPEKVQHGLLYGFAVIWFLMSISFRMSNYSPSSKKQAAQLYYPPLAFYRTGELSEEKVTDMFRSGYPAVARIINQETQSLVYHASTQLPYFIKKSDARCLADHFFEFFIWVKSTHESKKDLNQAFRYMGFRYFIVDLKLPMVDKTADKTLSRKFDEFMNYMYQNPEIELVATDRQIQLNSTGEIANAVFLNEGKLVKAGSFAVYRFK